MRKIILLSAIVFLFSSCGHRSDRIDRRIEDGIEVIINKIEPYRIEGESQRLNWEEEFGIDLEDEEISAAGLFEIDTFTVDLSGNIHILVRATKGDHIFKFNSSGEFLLSYGAQGQGPGELNLPNYITATDSGEIAVSGPVNSRLAYFSGEGTLLREIPLTSTAPFVHPLSNRKLIIPSSLLPDENERYLNMQINLCHENFKILKTLDVYRIENFSVSGRIRGTQPGFGLCTSTHRIYSANESRGYEIWVYDHEGGWVRKIRKEYQPVPVSEEIKAAALERNTAAVRPMVYFPESLPPVRTLFADENGRLFAVTFEPGASPGEDWIDVFSAEGVFTGRLSAPVVRGSNTPVVAAARHNRIYFIRDTESGFKRLVAGRLIEKL